MIDFLFLATSPVDPTSANVLSLIGSLGQSGAALFVVWLFIQYLRSDGDKRDKRYEELLSRCMNDIDKRDKTYEDLVSRCTDVIKDNTASNREFSRATTAICRASGVISKSS